MDFDNQGMVVKGMAFRNAVCCLGNFPSLSSLGYQQSVRSGATCWMKDHTARRPERPIPLEKGCSDSVPPPRHNKSSLLSLPSDFPPRDQRFAKDLSSLDYRENGNHVLPNSERKRTQEGGLEEVPPLN